jgi:hypothetical protein
MQCVTDLVKLRDAVISRSRHLRLITSGISSPIASDELRTLAYASIELDNVVVTGLRQYAKSSLLRSRTASGVRVTATVNPKSTEEAAAFVFQSVNPVGYAKAKSPKTISERQEAAFRDPKTLERILTDYAASNLVNVTLAVSLNADVFAEAKLFRHFFAHRARNTFEEVQTFASKVGIVGTQTPEHLLVRGRPGTGVRFIDGWLADVENFFDLAT